MKLHTGLLLSFSSIMYAVAFWFPDMWWWLSFVCVTPVITYSLNNLPTFSSGWFWGACSLGLHLSGILHSVFLMGTGPPLPRIVPLIMFIVYLGLYGGITFFCIRTLYVVFNIKYIYLRTGITLLMLWCYFIMLNTICLWIFGKWEGCLFFSPLLPLAVYPALQGLLPIFGGMVTLFLLLCVSSAVCLLMVNINRTHATIFIITIIPWTLFFFFPNSSPHIIDSKKFGYLPLKFSRSQNTEHLFDILAMQCKQLIDQQPEIEIVLLPESAFSDANTLQKGQSITQLNSTSLGKPVHICIGSKREKNNHTFNAMFWIQDGIVHQHYDKKHTMPLIERLPTWFNMFQPSFCTTQITGSHAPIPSWFLGKTSFSPSICSDLFFFNRAWNFKKEDILLTICSDIWGQYPYISRLMLLAAQYQSIILEKTIVYISYYYGVIIHNGTIICIL